MPSKVEEDWSDSDEDAGSEVETSVLLGVPDGPIEAESDLTDAAVSRIGGHPAFLTLNPPLDSSYCKNCSQLMELMVQMWCPFEDSPLDRALYVWGCANGGCQRKLGSVRAWRAVRHNKEYAAKLEKKLARQQRLKGPAPEATKPLPKSNPFAMGSTGAPGPFGLGSQIFGGVTLAPEASSAPPIAAGDGPEDKISETTSDDEEELVTAMATATLETSPWTSAPAYPPLYLSTTSEYIPPPPKLKLPPGVTVEDPLDDEGKSGGWAPEGYENSMDLDHVFERFAKRVASEGEQCIRYELNGTPLPFASDSVFDSLFPAPVPTSTVVTKPEFKVQPLAPRRTYTPAPISPCPTCNAKRVFECQLMPNLINVLKVATPSVQSHAERHRELEAALGKGDRQTWRGMEWGTCMVFSCEKDCCGSSDNVKESWTEEVVLVQWDV